MKPFNREYYRKCFTSIVAFMSFGLLIVVALTTSLNFLLLSLVLLAPCLIMILIVRFSLSASLYLILFNYTLLITLFCLTSVRSSKSAFNVLKDKAFH